MALAKGEEIGLAKGELNRALAIARNLLDVISDNTVLAAKTGLSAEQIQYLPEPRDE